MEFSLDFLLGNVEESAAAARALIAIDCQGDALLEELLDGGAAHVWLVVGIEVAHDEDTAGSTHCVVTLGVETVLVHRVDLVALVGVPPRANHTRAQSIAVVVNDLTHDSSSRSDWRQVSELIRLNIDVIPNILCNSGGMRRSTTPLAIDALVNGLKLVRARVANEHRVGTPAVSGQHDAAVVLAGDNGGSVSHGARSTLLRGWQLRQDIWSHLSEVGRLLNQILVTY